LSDPRIPIPHNSIPGGPAEERGLPGSSCSRRLDFHWVF
jgi:hypothetical protein